MNLASTGWPSAGNVSALGWGTEPQNMMPKRTQGWPAGTQRAAGDAERLLSTAVGWWDAAYYTAGDRFLRNRGVAGDLLNMRLGSALAANSNDPRYTAPEEVGYCYLPGVSGCYLSVPSSAVFNAITGNIDIRVLAALDDWTPSAAQMLVARNVGDPNRGWRFSVQADGKLQLDWFPLGTNASIISKTSTVAATAIDGQPLWVRVTLTVDNGSTQNEVRFYTSTDDGVTWTQLGTTVTTAGVTSLPSVTAAVEVGGNFSGTASLLAGKVYRVQVYNGIAGTLALDVNPDVVTDPSQTTFVEQSSNAATVTINRATSGRKTVAMPARGRGGRACFLLGTDDYFEVQDNWQHRLLNFEQGDSFTVLAVVRQWATAANGGRYLDKQPASTAGWSLRTSAATITPSTIVTDGVNTATSTAGAQTAGALLTLAGVIDRTGRQIVTNVNGSAATSASTTTVGSSLNTAVLNVGRRSGATTYQDFEFTAAAVLRRALTAAELTTLTTYFQNRNL